ncbi:MAG TPA: hypothetical protein VL832_17565 [Puia sp.]|nr:hypothetical protein [Puia sp.]
MALIRHTLLLGITKWILFISSLVLFGNRLSSQFYVHSGGHFLIHGNIKKSLPNFGRPPQQFPIRKYKAIYSIDKRYLEPVLLVLQAGPFGLVYASERENRIAAFLMQFPVDAIPRFDHLRGPPAC